MKQSEILRAYSALKDIQNIALPAKTAHAVFMTQKTMKTQIDFQVEHQKKLIAKHGGTISPTGEVIFPDNKVPQAFLDDMDELMTSEAELNIEPISVPLEAVDGQALTPADITALEGIVDFK